MLHISKIQNYQSIQYNKAILVKGINIQITIHKF